MAKIIPFKHKKSYELDETYEQWVVRLKNIEKEWTIDFDEDIRNNAHSIPEKIAVFIWEHTGKTGYLYIEDIVKGVFYSIYFLMSIIFFGIFLVFLLFGLEKLYLFLHRKEDK